MNNLQTIFEGQIQQHRNLESEKIRYNKNLVEVEISQLRRPTYSSRKPIENQINVLDSSLSQYGFLGGVFVEADCYQVIDGWHRSRIWQQLGNITIPCYLVSCLSKQERVLHLFLNNQCATFSPVDFGCEFEELDLKDFGFSEADLHVDKPILQSKFPFPQNLINKEFAKLSTTIPIKIYESLKAIKSETDAQSMSETIINLVNHYYDTI